MAQSKMRRGLKSLWLVGMAAAMAVVSACGAPPAGGPGGAQGTGTGGAQNSTATPPANTGGGKIQLAYLGGFTGDYAPWTKENHMSAVTAVNEMNAAGGVLGMQLEILPEDNKSTVEGGIQGYRRLVTTTKTVAAIGTESDAIIALLKTAKESKVPILAGSAGTPDLDTLGGDYVFRTAPSDSLNGIVSADILLKKGFKKLAMMVENVEGARANAEHFKKSYSAAGGQVQVEVVFNSGQNTYQSELKKLFDAKPEITYFFGGLTAGTVIFKEWFQRGYGGKWFVSTEILSPDLITSAGAQVTEGFMGVVPAEDVNSEGFKRFVGLYKKDHGKEPSAGMYDAHQYDITILAGLAMQAAGKATGEAINAKIREVANPPGVKVTTFADGVAQLKQGKDIDYEGASGPVNFNETGNVRSSFALQQIKNGQLVQVDFFPATN